MMLILTVSQQSGKGKFGTVSCYRERSTDYLYAFKEISIKKKTNIGMLQDEVTALSILSRENNFIVKYYDSFVHVNDNRIKYIIVTEYISKFTLHDYLDALIINKQIAPPTTVFNLVLWLFSTLTFIHKKGYVHRDIKPENIMIDIVGNRFVLLDFGLRCSIRQKTGSKLKLRQVAGTPEFI